MRRTHDRVAGRLDPPREPQRRLAAELRHDADRLLPVEHREHLLRRERLEVEAVGCVVVGRDGLRVAVDHHRLVAESPERLHGVDAAVVELDPLPDPVRPGADDHDARLRRRRQRFVRLAPGRVVVVRGGLDLAGARVDAAVGRPDALRERAAAKRRRPLVPHAAPIESSPQPARLARQMSRDASSRRACVELLR